MRECPYITPSQKGDLFVKYGTFPTSRQLPTEEVEEMNLVFKMFPLVFLMGGEGLCGVWLMALIDSEQLINAKYDAPSKNSVSQFLNFQGKLNCKKTTTTTTMGKKKGKKKAKKSTFLFLCYHI